MLGFILLNLRYEKSKKKIEKLFFQENIKYVGNNFNNWKVIKVILFVESNSDSYYDLVLVSFGSCLSSYIWIKYGSWSGKISLKNAASDNRKNRVNQFCFEIVFVFPSYIASYDVPLNLNILILKRCLYFNLSLPKAGYTLPYQSGIFDFESIILKKMTPTRHAKRMTTPFFVLRVQFSWREFLKARCRIYAPRVSFPDNAFSVTFSYNIVIS